MTARSISKGVVKDIIFVAIGLAIITASLVIIFGTMNPFYVVSSGSMIPELEVFDVIIVNAREPFEEIEIGDIIVFNRPSGHDRVIVHRVVSIIDDNPHTLRTKGDANPASIPGTDFPVTAEEYIGQVQYVIPQVGYITRILSPPINYIIIAVIIGIMIFKQFYKKKGKKVFSFSEYLEADSEKIEPAEFAELKNISKDTAYSESKEKTQGMTRLFGTNGIRGVFSGDFNLDFVHDITLAIGSFFKEGPILVGYDGRDSSPVVAKMVCSALNYSGIDCKQAGLVPTPCLQYATKSLGYKGGIMITASHNPPEYNGIKPVASDGVEISREDELIVEDIYFNKKWPSPNSRWGITLPENNAIVAYLDAIKSHVYADKIRSRKFKIVLDLGNGAQAKTAPKLCNDLGCEVITINEKIDGSFPGRGSEPTPENLQDLSDTVVKNEADLGIAFDGDGDRAIFCDNKGRILTGDKSALLLSKYILENNPQSTVVTCLNSGSSIETLTQSSESKVIRTKVGSVEVSRKMVSVNALIGFEENGGFMYGNHNQVRDGAMTLALALELLSLSDKTLAEQVDLLPSSFTTKDKVACSKEDAQKIIKTLDEENPNSDLTDGIKINFDEKNWIMVRPSGTEPIIRVYAEASSQEKLDKLMSEHLQKIKSIIAR